MQSKLYEKQLLAQIEKCKQNEANARQEVRKILLEQAQRQQDDKDLVHRQLNEEKLRTHDLELRVRELEVQSIKEVHDRVMVEESTINCERAGVKGTDVGRQVASGRSDIPGSDYALLVNSIVYLINKEAESRHEREGALSETDIRSARELDSVYKLVILQLTKKL